MGASCGYMALAEGTACSMGVCNPVGDCVECNVATDCPGANDMCAGNVCMEDTCANETLDDGETDVDCGGPQCNPCLNTQSCLDAGDCASNFCNAGTCAACTPGDCAAGEYCDGAGVCLTSKALGEVCAAATECTSANCVDGVCCDNVCDGDCVGCNLAGTEGTCSMHPDGTDPDGECGADSCNGAGACRCADGMTNGAETDTDCGGGVCAGCADGGTCVGNGDCSSGLCDGTSCAGVCANLMLDAGETDVDCGGATCPACGDNLMCLQPSDCQSGVCTGNTCAAPTCNDVTQNGQETDVDCGGGTCSACPNNAGCIQPSDCQSGVCSGNICSAPSCGDMLQNGMETDIDCGGPTCDACVAGQGCVSATDCNSGVCTLNVCQCSPALNVQPDGSGPGTVTVPSLVMSEISPGNYIELFNTTGSAINLGGSAEWLCSPFAYSKLSNIAPTTTVPALGYATVPWPVNFTDVDAGGEVILYANASFGDNTQILDFTCWGINPHGSRKTQAEAVGKWSGSCNAALSSGALHRVLTSNGVTAGSYITTTAQSPMNCTP